MDGKRKAPDGKVRGFLLYEWIRRLFQCSFFFCFTVELCLHSQPNNHQRSNDQPEYQVRAVAEALHKFECPLEEIANTVKYICHIHSSEIFNSTPPKVQINLKQHKNFNVILGAEP